MLKTAVLLSVLFATSNMVSAANFSFSETGAFSSSDVAGALVAPNGTFNLTFVLAGNPTPLAGSVTSLGFDAPFLAFSYTLNGKQVAVAPSELHFSTLANAGLFDVTFGTGLNANQFVFEGAQVFTGTTAAPVFSAGKFAVTNWTYSDPSNYDVQTPSSASLSVSQTPEPSSASLTLGVLTFLTTVAAARRKSIFSR